MKLKIFTPSNTPDLTKGAASINITQKGIITFTKPAVELLGLKVGDKAALAQDEASPKDWHVIPNHKEGFKVGKKTATSLVFNNVSLAKLIFQSYGVLPGNVRIPVAPDPLEYNGSSVFTLITATLKKLSPAPNLK